jgi:hypothetical protein
VRTEKIATTRRRLRQEHLVRCLVYIDLNMVRAGVVAHPSEWEFNGYNEIQTPRERYSLTNEDLSFLLKLGEEELKILVAKIRERIDQVGR